MPKIKITAAAVEKMKPSKSGRIDYFDEVLPAFGIRVSEKGVKSWFVMTRVHGRLIRVTLGRYPMVGLGAAREKAREAMEYASTGIDPRNVREEERRANEEIARNTYGFVAKEFMTKYVKPKLKESTAKEYKRVLLGRDVDTWLKRPVSAIIKRDMMDHLDRVAARASDHAADNQLAYLRKFFNWCADRDIIEIVPTDRVRRNHPILKRDRVLDDKELKLIWTTFQQEGGVFGDLFQILLLTGQRRGEVREMNIDELTDLNGDEPMWKIPASKTKNKLPHMVPLTPQMLNIIRPRTVQNVLIFSTNHTTAVSGFSVAKRRIDSKLKGVGDWRLHDLRRTMVTVMNEKLSIAPHVVEAVVNHITGPAKLGVAGVYNRALYLKDRRSALNAWNGYLDALNSGD